MFKWSNSFLTVCFLFQEKFEDTKEVMRSCKLKKNRQHNGKIKEERTNNNLQNITQKTKIQAK